MTRAAKLAVGVAAIVMATSCSSSEPQGGGRLRVPGDARGGGFGQDDVGINRPITALTMTLCSDGPAVRIKGVHLNGATGLRLVDWGSRRFGPGLLGGRPGLATDVGFSHRPIDRPCPGRGAMPIFAVTVERTGPTVGTARSFTITFPGGAVDVPFGLALCAARCTSEDLGG